MLPEVRSERQGLVRPRVGERLGKEENGVQEDRRGICGPEVTVWSNEGEEWLKMSVERLVGRPGPGHMGPCTMVKSLNSILRATGYQ